MNASDNNNQPEPVLVVHHRTLMISAFEPNSPANSKSDAMVLADFFAAFNAQENVIAKTLGNFLQQFDADFRNARVERVGTTPHINMLRIFGLEYAELRHSDVLAWFLDPDAEHEQGAVFANALLGHFGSGYPRLDHLGRTPMKKLLFLTIAVGLSIVLGGCVTGTAVQTGDHTYPPVANWQTIKVVFEKPARPYEVIGPVSALGAPAAQERAVYDMLRQQAAKLGADEVIVGSTAATAYRDGFSQGKQNSGLAIKFTDAKIH